MRKGIKRKSCGIQIYRSPSWCRNNNVWRICEKRSLDSIGHLLGKIDCTDIFRAKRSKGFDYFQDLVGELAGWYEDQGGGALGGGCLCMLAKVSPTQLPVHTCFLFSIECSI